MQLQELREGCLGGWIYLQRGNVQLLVLGG